MQLILKQKDKKLFSANFEIIENNNIVGNISMEGKVGTMEVSLNGLLYEKKFNLKCLSEIKTGNNKRFRPYNILENSNVIGQIYQTEFKRSIFSKYDYNKCFYKEQEYNLYSIGLGEKSVNVLFKDNVQIAQIEKDGTIYNDLHNYNIYSIDRESTFISVLMSCYMYIIACYKPGLKITDSVKKVYSKTTNKDLISKYDPNWIKKLEEK